MKVAREYKAYGINQKRFIEILQYMLNLPRDELLVFAKRVDEYSATYLVESLVNNVSYDQINAKYLVPFSKSDFYRKRRQLFHLVDCHMKNASKGERKG